ncbi:Xylanase inhibitor, N-terminal [Dillenia turbinata]|uniref:Xylanase inhibitor, N-terminal n=1 Tax=Dillenia turbinata TaxID=194707 RepID=A0AAN8V582_9MAGN
MHNDGFLLGCDQYNYGLFDRTAGLLGLGQAAESLVSQTTQKHGRFFFYCVPTPSGSNGFLSFVWVGGTRNVLKFTDLGQNADQNLNIPPSIFSIMHSHYSLAKDGLCSHPLCFPTTNVKLPESGAYRGAIWCQRLEDESTP